MRGLRILGPLIFVVYPICCFLLDQVDWKISSSKEVSFNFKEHKKRVYKNWFNPVHGLELGPGINKGDRYNENGVLFYVQWLLLLDEYGQIEKEDKDIFFRLVTNLESFHKGQKVKGIYDRGGQESLKHKKPRLISHDNITAIVAGSSLFKLNFGQEVAAYGLKNLMNFDNQNVHKIGIKNLQVHPRDWFFWLRSSDNPFHQYLSYFSFPIFLLAGLEDPINHIKCRPVWWERIKDSKIDDVVCFVDSSGPLLWYVRYRSLKRVSGLVALTKNICERLYKINYGKNWRTKLFKIYFKHPFHPNIILAQLYLDQRSPKK